MDCKDSKCPEHGSVSVRGRTFEGTVVKAKMDKSAIVEWPRITKVPKYDRVFRTSSKVMVHVPECLKVKAGDKVKIGETRKLSKAKSFVVLEVLSHGGKKN
ncbi:MAG: 30S ribosomal protein S17 [Candidatus Altiarchaeota archaeon]|nr:30S ribosomal protein S17 [Candidatus Altiarchaeota archaeon]